LAWPTPAGDVRLPLNLRLRFVSAPQARLELATTAPIALDGGRHARR